MKLISKVIVGVVSALALTGTTLGGIAIGQKSIPGETGPQGEQGPKGETGAQGPQGEKGDAGASGKSAYEIAKAGGYTGTEAQWIASLKGEAGGKGDTGAAGKSAYEIAKAGGYTGTEEQWIASLKGETGAAGKSAYELYVASVQQGETPMTEAEWKASLKGETGAAGKSAYEIYCENNPDYEGTEEEFSEIFNGLLNKGNSSYLTFIEPILEQNYSKVNLSYNDIMPVSELDVNDACENYFGILDQDMVCDIDTVLTAYETSYETGTLTGKVHAELDGDNGVAPRLYIEASVEAEQGGEVYYPYRDEIYFTDVEDEYYMFFTCECGYEDASHYKIKIPDENIYYMLLAVEIRNLHMCATQYQFERRNYNVVNPEVVGVVEDYGQFAGRIAGSEYYADMDNFMFSMKNDDEFFGFEYSYSFSPFAGIITSTDSKVKNFFFEPAAVVGDLVSHTELNMNVVELDSGEASMLDDFSDYYYSFFEVLLHSAGNVSNCMLVYTDFYTGYSEDLDYYNYKKPSVPDRVEAYSMPVYYNVGDTFNPNEFGVTAYYDNHEPIYACYDNETFACGTYSLDIYNLPLDSNGKFKMAGTFQVGVYYHYALDDNTDYSIYTPVTIYVRGGEKVTYQLFAYNLVNNYTIGEAFDPDTLVVVRVGSDGSMEQLFPYDEETNPNGYQCSMDSALIPIDEDGNFKAAGTYELIIATEEEITKTLINVQSPYFGLIAYGNRLSNYVVGEEFDIDDITVIAYDSELNPIAVDMELVTVTSNAPMSYGKFTAAGTYTCIVRYHGVVTSFEFTVDPAAAGEPKLVNLCLEGQTLNLIQGNDFEIGDLQVTGYYADGTSAKIEAYDEQTNPNGYVVDDSEVNMFNVGIYPVYVSVGNLKVTYYVFVTDAQPE